MNTNEHRFFKKILNTYLCYFLLIFGLFFISSCQNNNSNNQINSNQNSNESSFEIPKSNINLEKPLKTSQKPEDIALCKKIDETIKQSEFSKARWGIIAISLKDGRIVCEKEGQKLFNPASIHKLLTSIVSFDKLGESFRWKTSIYAKNEIKNGILDGDLILYGQGSPDFNKEQLDNLVQQLKRKGLKSIKGDIIGDESFFKGDKLGDGWTWNAAQWYYGAASSALSFNQNQAKVFIENGKPKSELKYLELTGEVQPVEDIEAIGLKRELGTNKVYVWGNGKNLNVKIAISQPALLSAKILKETLETNGIIVEGKAKSVDWKSSNKLNPQNATEIASIQSSTLAEIIHKMNKDSVNFHAEIILRTLGKKFGYEAPDDNPKMQKLRGDDSAGASVIKKWLSEKNISTNEIAIHDGSGLSRLNYITPESIGRALVFASQSKFTNTFKNSLPVSGQSGTLRGRLGTVSGNILGKTGSIAYVNSLAGYAKTSDETFAFVIIGNNLIGKGKSFPIIDKIVSSLVTN